MKNKPPLKTSLPTPRRTARAPKKGAGKVLATNEVEEMMAPVIEAMGAMSASEMKRLRIVMTAAQLFAQKGFHATGMRQICDAVGMSPGGLYRYFASKEEIIAGLIALDRQRTAVWFASLPEKEGLMACLESLTELASGDFDRSGFLAMWTEITAEAARNPAVRAPFAEHYQYVEGLIAGLVEKAKKAGDIRPDTKAKDVATFVMSGFEGLMVRRALVPEYDFDKGVGKLLAFIADAVGSRRPKRERGVRS